MILEHRLILCEQVSTLLLTLLLSMSIVGQSPYVLTRSRGFLLIHRSGCC
jgi:hypothetical protein